MSPTKTNTGHKKRHGQHQKRTKRFTKVYHPFLPLLLVASLAVLLGGVRPMQHVLPYATHLSDSNLLAATNAQRANHGQPELALSQQLTKAAQAKADDMVMRDYWSHVTPDGHEPWVFVDKTGYAYIRAGENLAYGFLTGKEAVLGWLNSPSHRANMLDGSYSEVGFGYAKSVNFNGTGPQTVVVAFYAQPQTAVTTTIQPLQAAQQSGVQEMTSSPQPISSDIRITAEVPPKAVARVQLLTGGQAPWSLYATSLAASVVVLFMLIRHSLAIRHLLRDGQRFALKHPLLDTTLVSLVLLAIILASTSGVVL